MGYLILKTNLLECKSSWIVSLYYPGAYAPLTKEDKLVVDGILASCYADFNHDLAHFAMTPMQWFERIVEWIFGENTGYPMFVHLVKDLGTFILPGQNSFSWNLYYIKLFKLKLY